MRLLEVMENPCIFGYIPVGKVNVAEFSLRSFVDCPTHNAHLRCIPEGLLALDIKRNFSPVICLVAGLAQRYEVARGVASGLPRLDVMYVEYRIFRLPMAVLAFVVVAEKNVLSDVPESKLRALLVVFSLNIKSLHTLCVELPYLDRGS